MPEDITALAHERDGDGELLPVEEDIEIHGTEVTVDVYPATTGQANEWRRRLQDEPEDLDDEVVADLLDEFVALEPEDFGGAPSWDDVRPAITDALASVAMAKIFDAEDTNTFADALQEAASQATGEGQGN